MPELHNALTAYPKLQDAFRRTIGETSVSFAGLERGGETLTPILDMWALPEWALLRGEVIYSRRVFVAALAANFSFLELVNPTGSGVLAVVLEISNSSAQAVDTNVDTGAALGVVATNRGVANDCRYPNLGEVSRCTYVSGQAAAGVALPQDTIAAGVRSTRPYVIQPGKKLFIMGTTLNTATSVSVLFTERPLLAGESGV